MFLWVKKMKKKMPKHIKCAKTLEPLIWNWKGYYQLQIFNNFNELRKKNSQNPSLYKLKAMLSLCNVTLYRKICGFIRKIIKY
jgi:hypothetical protein